MKALNKMVKSLFLSSILILNPLTTTQVNALSIPGFTKLKSFFSPQGHVQSTPMVIMHSKDDKLGERFYVRVGKRNINVNSINRMIDIINGVQREIENATCLSKEPKTLTKNILSILRYGSRPTTKKGVIYMKLLWAMNQLQIKLYNGGISFDEAQFLSNKFSPILEIIDKWEEAGDLSYEVGEIRSLLYLQ